jgi:hypothetical protein
MAVISLNKYGNEISKNVQEADVMTGELSKAAFFGKVQNLLGEPLQKYALDLETKRTNRMRLEQSSVAKRDLVSKYYEEKARLDSAEYADKLEQTGGIVDPNPEMGIDKHLPYDQYLNEFYNKQRENSGMILESVEADEVTKSLYQDSTFQFEDSELIKNIRTTSEYSTKGMSRASKDLKDSFLNEMSGMASGYDYVSSTEATYSQLEDMTVRDSSIDPTLAAYYFKKDANVIADTALDKVSLELKETQNMEQALNLASRLFADDFQWVKGKGIAYIKKRTVDEMASLGGEDGENYEQLLTNISNDAGILSDEEYIKEMRSSAPQFMSHATPEKKAKVLHEILTMSVKLKEEKKDSASRMLSTLTSAFGNRHINDVGAKELAFAKIREHTTANRADFSTEELASSVYDAAVNEVTDKLVEHSLSSPGTIYNSDKEAAKIVQKYVFKMYPDEIDVQRMVLDNPTYNMGKLAELQQKSTKGMEQARGNMYKDPDGFIFKNDQVYGSMLNKLMDKSKPLNYRELENFVAYRDKLVKKFGVTHTSGEMLARDLVTSLTERVQEGLALDPTGLESGRTLEAIRQATRLTPGIYLSVLDKTKLSDEQKSSLITSNVGLKTQQEQAYDTTSTLKVLDKESLKAVHDSLEMDAAAQATMREKVKTSLKPWTSGIKFITSRERVFYEESLANALYAEAVTLRAGNPELDESTAIGRVLEKRFSGVKTIDTPSMKGLVNVIELGKSGGNISDRASYEIKTFKENVLRGKLLIDYEKYPKFFNTYGGTIMNASVDKKDLAEKFFNTFSNLTFVNTDHTGKSNSFILHGTMGMSEEPVRIFMKTQGGKSYEYKMPGTVTPPKGRGPSSINEKDAFDDYDRYLSPEKYKYK